MNILILGSAALLAIGASIPAHAADMVVKAPLSAPEPPAYNWSGVYVGVNFGGGWSSGSLNIPGNNFYGGIGYISSGPLAAHSPAGLPPQSPRSR
jgi:opacity protein-like surface antigen